jgi:hypothetical protein
MSLRDRLELLAFDARLACVPQALLQALWKAIDGLHDSPSSAKACRATPSQASCSATPSARAVLTMTSGIRRICGESGPAP